MAITYSLLTASSSTTDTTTYSTASITPTANTLVCAGIIACDSASISDPSVVGCNITWNAIISYTNAAFYNISSWYGWSSSPTTDTVDFTFSTTVEGAGWWVFQLPGAMLEAPIRAATDIGTTTIEPDVGTALSTSGLFGGAGKSVSSGTLGTWTPGTGYTEVLDVTIATSRRVMWLYDVDAVATDGIVDATCTGGTGPVTLGIAWECRAATPTRVPVNLAASHYMGR